MSHIDKAVEEVLPMSTGRFRYRLVVEEIYFHSAPLDKEKFLGLWEDMTSHSDLSNVQYESKVEYTPGNYIWQTF